MNEFLGRVRVEACIGFRVRSTRTFVLRPLLPFPFLKLARKQQFIEYTAMFFLALIRAINCYFVPGKCVLSELEGRLFFVYFMQK
jgi:hypothetical protein